MGKGEGLGRALEVDGDRKPETVSQPMIGTFPRTLPPWRKTLTTNKLPQIKTILITTSFALCCLLLFVFGFFFSFSEETKEQTG